MVVDAGEKREAMAESSQVYITLQWNGPTGKQVELLGDFPDWNHPVAMREGAPGHYECHLHLEPGLYRYKFRINQTKWKLDPNALVVDQSEGYTNAVLVVGGIISPVLFAPDRQHWAQWEDGRLVIQAETYANNPAPQHICLLRAEALRGTVHQRDLEPDKVPLLPMMNQGNRTLYRAEVRRPPKAPPWTHVYFEGAPQHTFLLPPPRTPLGQPPKWLQNASLYAIFVDRWHRGSQSLTQKQFASRTQPSTATTFYGGDLEGVIEHIDYIAGLGVTGLALSPLHRSPTPHRYDSIDLSDIDPLLGGDDAFVRLLDAAHKHNLKVVMDISVTHVNEQHEAFQDLLEKQHESSYKRWFFVRDFPVKARDASTFSHYPKRPELPWLDLGPGPAREHALETVEKWVKLGVDGLRLDAVEEAPPDFWQELRRRTRHINPELLLLGEVVSDRPGRLAEHGGLDTVTDFQHREAMLDFFAHGAIDAETFWTRQSFHEFRMGPFEPTFRLSFLDNHDTLRFLTEAQSQHKLHLALAYLAFRPEPLWLTYGTELNFTSKVSPEAEDLVWPERLPMEDRHDHHNSTQTLLRHLMELRRTLEPMYHRCLRLVRAKEQLLVLERVSPHSTLRGYFYTGSVDMMMEPMPPHTRCLLRTRTDEEPEASTEEEVIRPPTLSAWSAQWFLFPS